MRFSAAGSSFISVRPLDAKRPKDRSRKNYQSIQYLRAISAVMVIFFHSAVQSTAISGAYAPPSGKFGVDIFFVISGFVMWESVSDRKSTPTIFLKKRFCRIVPLYWGFTLAVALVALLEPGLLRSTVFNLPHLAASLAFVAWPNPAAENGSFIERLTPVINPGWTLNLEMLFYIIFASMLLAPRYLWFYVLSFEMMALRCIATNFKDVEPIAQFYAQGVMFEFLFGGCVSIILCNYRTPPRLFAVALIPLTLAVLFWADLAQPIERRWIWLGLPAAILVTAVVSLEKADRMPRIGWLARIGSGSYSIYLSHVFVIAGARTAIQITGTGGWLMRPLIFIPFGILASVGIGMCVHYLLERPLTALSTRLMGVS